MRTNARGQRGELRVGGRAAAEFGPWQLTGTAEAWTLSAPCKGCDPYLMDAAEAFEVRIEVGTRVWRWKGLGLQQREPLIVVAGTGHPELL